MFLLNGALSQAFPLVCLNVAALGCKALLQDTKGHTAGKEPIFSPEEGCGCAHTMNLSASLLDSKQFPWSVPSPAVLDKQCHPKTIFPSPPSLS